MIASICLATNIYVVWNLANQGLCKNRDSHSINEHSVCMIVMRKSQQTAPAQKMQKIQKLK